MICPNCGNQVNESEKFCSSCGTSMNQSVIQQVPVVNQDLNGESTVNQGSTDVNKHSNNQDNKKIIIIAAISVVVLTTILVFIISKFFNKCECEESVVNNNVPVNNDTTSNTEPNNDIQNNTGTGDTTGTVDPNTNLTYDKDGAFLMPVEDVFTITGRGTVVTGRIERGTIKINEEVQIIGLDHEIKTTVVTGIESFREQKDSAQAGDNVGLLLRGISREEVERGLVLAKPNSIKASKKFEGTFDIYSKEEGGRHTPFFTNYQPQFYFRTADIAGKITLPSGVEMVMPGDKNVKITVSLEKNVALEVGMKITIREGGRTIGEGKVTKVY